MNTNEREVPVQVSLSTVKDLVLLLEDKKDWTVDDIFLSVTLSNLLSLLKEPLGGDGTSAKEIFGLRYRLQSLAARTTSILLKELS